MTVWHGGAIALLPSLAIAVIAAGRGPAAGRLIALQLASVLGTMIAAMLTFAFDQPSAIDLALALALLTLPATLLFALFEERWL